MRKIGLLLLVLLLSLALFANGNSETSEKTTVVFWHPYGDGSWTGDYMNNVIEEFEALNPDIVIESQAYADYASIIEGLQRAVAADQMPSLVTIGYGYDRYVLNSGKAVPFNAFLEQTTFDDFFEQALAPTVFDGDVYGIPFALSVPVVFYHSELFSEAGLDPDNPPQTWEEFIEATQILHDRLGIYGAAFALDDPWSFECLLKSAGGYFLDDDNIGVNSDTAKSILEDWGKGADAGYFLYNSNFSETLMSFGAKQVGMFLVSSYGTVTYRDSDPLIKVGPLPKGNESSERLAPIGGNSIYLFGNDDEERAAAAQFVDFLTSSSKNAEWAENSGYLPTRKSSLEAMADFLAGFDNYNKVVGYIGILDSPTQWPARHVLRINQILMEAIESVMLGNKNSSDALDDAASEIIPLLDE